MGTNPLQQGNQRGRYALFLALGLTKSLGAYVAWFAVVSVIFGRMFFGDRATVTVWVGLALILVGSLVIQTGPPIRASSAAEAAMNNLR